MAESLLRLRMKESVSRELAGEGYSTFFEPRCSPSRFLTWAAYRPDLFCVREGAGRQEYALVECETRPSGGKLASENFRSVEVQTALDSALSVRLILVLPRGALARVDSSARSSWETWVFEGSGFLKFPRARPTRTRPSQELFLRLHWW